MTDTSLLCRFGPRCLDATREIVDGATIITAGLATARGLCMACEDYARPAVGALGGLYYALHAEIGKDAGRNVNPDPGHGPGAKVDPPVPIRLTVDAQCREIAWVLEVWATAVQEKVAAAVHGRAGVPDVAGWEPERCAWLLETYFSVLCALPSTAYLPYVRDGGPVDPVELDGPGAVVELVALYQRAQSWTGETSRVVSRDLPCPPRNPDRSGGCGRPGVLVQEIGSEVVRCRVCGWSCTADEYSAYAITFRFEPSGARRGAGVRG